MELNKSIDKSDWVPHAPWELGTLNMENTHPVANINETGNAIAIKTWHAAPVIESASGKKLIQYLSSYIAFGALLSLPLYGIYLSLTG